MKRVTSSKKALGTKKPKSKKKATARRKPSPAADLDIPAWAANASGLCSAYSTELGTALIGKSEAVLARPVGRALRGQVQLVFTSPPFPLNRKKKYGNKEGRAFKRWLSSYAATLTKLLTPTGSIVIEMGNAWMPRLPVMSTLAIETLLAFQRAANLYLVQEFIWHNPARLPSPAQWVTVNRMRVKDSFTRLWWLSPTPFPKADNRRVLAPYSGSMKSLLASQKYNAGDRPSEHSIGARSFLKDNGGAIPPNVLMELHDESSDASNLLVGANTSANDSYSRFCKAQGLALHPARMPVGLAKFFINLCTEEGDLVCDPFAGSNTTGAAADNLRRRWITIEADPTYAAAGKGRFPELAVMAPPREAPPEKPGTPTSSASDTAPVLVEL